MFQRDFTLGLPTITSFFDTKDIYHPHVASQPRIQSTTFKYKEAAKPKKLQCNERDTLPSINSLTSGLRFHINQNMKPMAQKKQLGYFQNIQPFQKSVTTIKGQEPPMIIKQQPIPRVQKQKKVNESPTLEKGNDILSRVIDSNESTETEKSEGTFASDILSGHFDISNTKKSRQMLMEKDKQPDSLPPLSETKSVNDKVLIRIGENVFISKSEVNGEMCVDIREYNNICGRLNPTDKGILLGMKEWNTIMKSVPFLTKWLSATPSI